MVDEIIMEHSDGYYRVCRVQRRVVGIFPEKSDAETFKRALKAQVTPSSNAALKPAKKPMAAREPEPSQESAVPSSPSVNRGDPAPAPDQAPLDDTEPTSAVTQADLSVAQVSQDPVAPKGPVEETPVEPAEKKTTPTPSPAKSKPSVSAAPPSATTDPSLFAEAERRLRDGEKLGTVADDLGIPFGRLRGWWASRSKHVTDLPAKRSKQTPPATRPREREVSAPAKVARTPAQQFTDNEELQLLSIMGGSSPDADIRVWAREKGIPAQDVKRHAEKLMRAGGAE